MDTENWTLEILEALARRIPFARRLYLVVTGVLSMWSGLGTIFEWFGIPRQIFALLTIMVALTGAPAVFYMIIAGLWRKKLRRAVEIIDDLTSLQKGSYCYESVRHRYVIQEGGDALCTREAEISSNGETIRAEQIRFGATADGQPVSDFEKLHFAVTATNRPVPLKNIVLSDDARQKRVVVILNPFARPEKITGYTICYRWPGLWRPLLAKGSDHGVINVKTPTKRLVLEVQVPDGLFIQEFNVSPDVGVKEFCRGGSTLLWTVDRPEEGPYRYELICSKYPVANVGVD